MMSYQTSEEKQGRLHHQKVDRKTGWQYVCLEEEWTRGYLQEIQISVNASPRAAAVVGSRTGV